jgi:hypothetical protein
MKARELTEAEAEALEKTGIEQSYKVTMIVRLVGAGCFIVTMIVMFALKAGGIL